MPQNSPYRLLTALCFVSVLGLGGCSTLADFTSKAWKTTTNFSENTGRSIASLLRPASRPQSSAESNSLSTSTRPESEDVYYADFMRKYGTPHLEQYEGGADIAPRRSAAVQTNEAGVIVHRPGFQNPQPNYIDLRPRASNPPLRLPPEVQKDLRPSMPVETGGQENENDDISWVKLGGGSNIDDWNTCLSSAGDIGFATKSGFMPNPAFSSCMRKKGYLPEEEAIRLLDQEN